MNAEWDADTYHRVSTPQVAWGERVLARVALRGNERVLDLGCGSGRLTAQLASRVPRGTVVGIDRSAQMLARAREHLGRAAAPPVHMVLAELPGIPVREWADLAFSTATFHWVRDHEALFAAVFEALRPGGRLVAQCGGEGNLHVFHQLALGIARSPAFRPWFDDWSAPWEFPAVEVTRRRLQSAGFVETDVWLEDAPTSFDDAATFAAFVRTVVLRPMLARLQGTGRREAFVEAVVAKAGQGTEPLRLDYRRLNLSATRPGGVGRR